MAQLAEEEQHKEVGQSAREGPQLIPIQCTVSYWAQARPARPPSVPLHRSQDTHKWLDTKVWELGKLGKRGATTVASQLILRHSES
jgi:hypothetical protein